MSYLARLRQKEIDRMKHKEERDRVKGDFPTAPCFVCGRITAISQSGKAFSSRSNQTHVFCSSFCTDTFMRRQDQAGAL